MVRFWLAIDRQPRSYAELAAKHAGGYAALDAMERQLAEGQFLAGPHYTIADIALYAYTHVADEGGFELDAYPAVVSWLERVASQAGHVPITG